MTARIDPDVAALLEGGCALIIGSVDADGEPRATRGWGATVVDAEAGSVRLVLPDDDVTSVENLRATGRIAFTATDVPTLTSLQAKGRVLEVAPATAADRRRASRYCDAFFGDVTRVDGTPRALLDRLVPPGYLACVAIVEECYDQTPGPAAGARMERGAR